MKFLRDLYSLVRPYGRRKLAMVAAAIVLQGVVQTLGVTSIMPFLALAANPTAARQSKWGDWILGYLPEMSDSTLLILSGTLSIVALASTNGVALMTVYISQRYLRGLSHWLRCRLMWQIATKDYSYFLQRSTGIMMKKVNGDARAVGQSILQPIILVVAACVNVLMLSAALIVADPMIAILAGVVLGSAYATTFACFRGFREQFSEGMRSISHEANRKALQLFGGIKPIKVQGVERPFIEEFEAYSLREARLLSKHQIVTLAPKQVIEPIAFATVVLIVIVAAQRDESLMSLIPTLGLMTMAAYRMLPNIQQIYSNAMTVTSHAHVLDEVLEEFDPLGRFDHAIARRQTAAVEPLQWERQVCIEEVSFRYPTSAKLVLDHLTITIPKNSSIAIVGPTGCGKSTLADLILGLHQPTAGHIRADDVILSEENRRSWQSAIGYVPQEIYLLDDTIRANVALGIPNREVDDTRLREACAAAQILSFIENDLPQSWRTTVGERGIRLSGGQRQRIGLARALYRQPELLILDEATSALDSNTEAAVVEAVRGISGSLTIIIIAHRSSTIDWCDNIVNLQEQIHIPNNTASR
jgi:ABC-type multidrug transport system fused ATPase/permease subunit